MTGAGKVVVTPFDQDAAQALCASGWTHAGEAFARHRIAAEAAQLEALREAREALGWAATRLAAWAATSLADGKPTAAAKIKEWEREARQALASLTAAIEKVTP